MSGTPSPDPILADVDTTGPLWVFGYGSLIWNPEFEVAEHVVARLPGFRRAFCMRSIHHRGTDEAPGLVLALDAAAGERCDGVAFRAAPGTEADTLKALRARELISAAYHERIVQLQASDGRALTALAYVISPDHPQYCDLSLEAQARIIARARGGRGPNADYLWNTARHLSELGLHDAELGWLAERVRELRQHGA